MTVERQGVPRNMTAERQGVPRNMTVERQGVPRNMTVKRRLEEIPCISKLWSAFFMLSNNQGNKEFRSDLDNLVLLIQSKSE